MSIANMAGGTVLACVIVLGCISRDTAPPAAPIRPAAVPVEAVWVGGADGGVFVAIKKRSGDPPAIYRGTIYEERSGEVWFTGEFELDPPAGAVDLSEPDILSGWDGQSLILKDGRTLRSHPG